MYVYTALLLVETLFWWEMMTSVFSLARRCNIYPFFLSVPNCLQLDYKSVMWTTQRVVVILL